MLSLKQRASEIAAASQRNPSLRRILDDVYERIDALEAAAAKPARKTPARKRKTGAKA